MATSNGSLAQNLKARLGHAVGKPHVDRKSTRLNSSHLGISYAVFCLIPPPPSSTLFPYTTLFRSQLYHANRNPSGGRSAGCSRTRGDITTSPASIDPIRL